MEGKKDLHFFQWSPGPGSRVHIERYEDGSFRAHAVFLVQGNHNCRGYNDRENCNKNKDGQDDARAPALKAPPVAHVFF